MRFPRRGVSRSQDAACEEAWLLFAQRLHLYLPLESDDKLGLTSKLWVAGFSFLLLCVEEWEMSSEKWILVVGYDGGMDLWSSSALWFESQAPLDRDRWMTAI